MSNQKPPPLPRDAAAAEGVKEPASERGEKGERKHFDGTYAVDFAIQGGRRFVDDPVEFEDTLSPYVQRRIRSIVERIQVGDTAEGEAAVQELLEIVDDRLDDVIRGRVNSYPAQGIKQRFAELDTRQGIYLTASGTLTQFNAILAAVHGAALIAVESNALKASMVAALVSHVVAAFFLCWAARPVDGAPSQTAAMALAQSNALTDDTFRSYRRGWRMTLIALVMSGAVAVLFVLGTLGFSLRPGWEGLVPGITTR